MRDYNLKNGICYISCNITRKYFLQLSHIDMKYNSDYFITLRIRFRLL